MTDHEQNPRNDPEGIVLKAKPRPVARFNKKLFAGVAIVSALVLSAIVGKAFEDKSRPKAATEDRVKVASAFSSEALAALPDSYAQVKRPEPEVREEPPAPPVETGTQASGESNDARNERLRLQQKRRDAKEAGVFFQMSQNRGQGAGSAASTWGSNNAPRPTAGEFNFNFERDQNNQDGKQDFLGRQASANVYNAYPLQDAVSPYQVMAGSVIAGSLLTGINSDLPGFVTAQVTENVYDTASGRFLLIPQGSRLIGRYDSVVTFGQKRALLVWQRLVMPDSSSISLENLPATDTSGYAGLADKVDAHTWQLIKGVALSTLLGVGTEIGFGDDEGDFIRALRESTQSNVNRAGQRIVGRNLDIQPTITIRQGWPLRVIGQDDDDTFAVIWNPEN